ncbi:MAG: sulfatase, partial [Anaerolineales bacterium]|nr:sulfatase [Anaerolineales bacterium]
MKQLVSIVLLWFALAFLAACTAPTIAPAPAATNAPNLPTSASSIAPNTPIAVKPSAAPTTRPTTSPTTQLSNYPTTRPNIIFILTDDLDVASIAFMPKLQELLVKQGATFNNFFVNVSVCCPSRATISRGQYTHNTKIFTNKPPDGGYETYHANGDENSTIAVWLQSAGYRTMHAGKYLNGYPNTVAPTFIPPGWTEWYSAAKGNPYSEYKYTLNENGKLVEYGTKPEDYGTDVYARKTIEFIQRSVKEGKPFFASINPYAPHGPSTPAPRHEKMFADAKLPRSPNFNEADVSDKPSFIKSRPLLTDRQITRIETEYRKRLQSLQAVDEMIENLIAALKSSGQLDNTYIFFTSDNGFHLGNHRLDYGKLTPYEEDSRVPMIVRGPGVPAGAKLDHIAGNIDFAPTWADLGGARAPDFVDGRSLLPVLKANPIALENWRHCFLLQRGDPSGQGSDDDDDDETGFDLRPPEMAGLLEPLDRLPDEVAGIAPQVARPANYQAIRVRQYTYVEYANGEKELYDLRADPYQLNNLAAK